MQGGFQKNIGCLMTSFLFRESVFYAKENGSRVDICFLDVKKAFDCVRMMACFTRFISLRLIKYFVS